MGIAQWSGGNRVLDGRQQTLPGTGDKKFTWTVAEILGLDGRRNSSFGRSSKYFVWTVVKICHLDGRRNLSFGPTSKFWTLEFFLDGRRKVSFGRSRTNRWIMCKEVTQLADDRLSIDSDLSRFLEKKY